MKLRCRPVAGRSTIRPHPLSAAQALPAVLLLAPTLVLLVLLLLLPLLRLVVVAMPALVLVVRRGQVGEYSPPSTR